MKLYYAPGACSLADHIALHEAGLAFDLTKVDLKAHRIEDGRPFSEINPKGYVPALEMNDGEVLTENVAILAWIADQSPALAPEGRLGRYRLLEALAFISAELHKAFKPFFAPGASDADKAAARQQIEGRLQLVDAQLGDGGLLGEPTVADAYLYVMLRWAKANGIALTQRLAGFVGRMEARPAVRRALQEEGLA
jgi:glutathione S-transferase